MSIGILIYSLTGNTLEVAEKIQQQLKHDGKSAVIERIEISKENPNSPAPIVLENIPDVTKYDKLIIGSPINGFSLSTPMKTYLNKHADIKGKEINCFVTQHFRQPYLGGNRGIRQITDLCIKKGGRVRHSGIIHWSSSNRAEMIDETVALLSRI